MAIINSCPLRKNFLLNFFFFLAFLPFDEFFLISNQRQDQKVEIRGIYGSPSPLWDLDYRLDDLYINAIFVHGSSISKEMIVRARSEGARVFAEFPTLNGKGYVKDHPEAWAIDRSGKRVDPATWFMGVCPTDPGFKSYRMNQLKELLLSLDVDGVWMDYVHFHAQFEEPEPILIESCFCDHCLSGFQSQTNIKISGKTTSERAAWILENWDDQWRDWRCRVIADWAGEMKQIIDQLKPGTLLGLYHCPWTDSEFNGARRYYLGLDYELLSKHIDVFSPMVYHGRMGRDAEWVKENIQWFVNKIEGIEEKDLKIWPIVQAYGDPDPISPDEFETVLTGAIEGGSTGVMMFTTRAIASDKDKILKMQAIYKAWERGY